MLMISAGVFVTAFVLSLVATRYVRDIAHAQGWLETPQLDRHVHTIPMPRIGGVAIFLSFAITVLGFSWIASRWQFPIASVGIPVRNLLGPALIVFLLGLYDDLRGVNPYWKFVVQALAATLLYFGGYGIHRLDLVSSVHPLQTFLGLPLTIGWVLLITNAFNLIDGLDGLAAGSALFSTLVIFILALLVPSPMIIILAIGLAGAILGFLPLNFHPASIFLGDSGSLFIGFMLSALAIAGSQKAPTMIAVAIPLVSLGLPILDVVLAVWRRSLNGKPIFKGDRDHIHHKLLKRGLSQREAVLLLYAVTAIFGFVSLLLLHRERAIALILALTGVSVLIGVRQLRYGEFDEMLSILQRSTRRRQLVANHIAIRRATESLHTCDEFQSICKVLQEAFQPIGFDAVGFQMLHPNGYPPASFRPMNYEPDGKLLLSWSEVEMTRAPWELRLELVTSSNQPWGYFSLLRLSNRKAIALDMNVLTEDFRAALAKAVERASLACESEQHKANGSKPRTSRVRGASSGVSSD
jgi:UDP-GlcNAc:undecaprenyl-phosphate/decaprenyl-phosphate GlcNAc-1-phosphate transferase